ncbi:MAG: aminotransferase class III-fold pyridoxal phosphate-dependent enzyme [Bacillota bacterium]
MVIDGAWGATVVDAEGNEYVDTMTGLWCVNIGYSQQAVGDAAVEQLCCLPYYPHTPANEPAALFAQELTRVLGGDLKRMYFTKVL